MADKQRSHGPEAPLCCQVEWLRRRRDLEDMPMRRVADREEDCPHRGGCDCCCQEELLALVREQNRVLCDLLGAVSCLTAAHLATGRRQANGAQAQNS